ncbi:radical SAM family heme chaperone HemW [Endomicrobium proavitum]|uniref:Heme chaperone HemW n=1 Tax=Endomicrobium proavitum TaxID=1408281 RepID=A0A0G3WJ48_9BACT|nr:radical SAM family heme chaperone HemW [Endomicrobium proavitum]AKL97479.1 oxygen-independent coproporphyrinogen III oxidase [Endomicrobium proavitum]
MTGLYIHIPFCKQKCFYCDFFSVKYDNALADKYVEAVISHAGQYKPVKVSTIYIGGGTPSVLSEKQIAQLLTSINKTFDISLLTEFTCELNPESVTPEKLKILKDNGVNRLSIGLQSSQDKDLQALGRIHNFDTFAQAFKFARETGFNNINLDLIYGLPNQTLSDWQKNLNEALQFNSEHISLYPLTIEPNTPLYANGTSTDDTLQRRMYEAAAEIFKKAGFKHYEISNWAKAGKESIHNSNYWRNAEYIALGAGASGYYNKKRYKIVEDIEKYIKQINLFIDEEVITDDICETETIILGLRLLNEGVDVKYFKSAAHKAALERFLSQKLLVLKNDRIMLAKNAVFTSNQILSEFV